MEMWLSCFLVLISVDSKTSWKDSQTSIWQPNQITKQTHLHGPTHISITRPWIKVCVSSVCASKHFLVTAFRMIWSCCYVRNPHSKVYGAYMGPTWGRQDPCGPHVGPMNLAIWDSHLKCNSDLAESCLPTAYCSVIRSVWIFAPSMALSLLYSMQNFKMTR